MLGGSTGACREAQRATVGVSIIVLQGVAPHPESMLKIDDGAGTSNCIVHTLGDDIWTWARGPHRDRGSRAGSLQGRHDVRLEEASCTAQDYAAINVLCMLGLKAASRSARSEPFNFGYGSTAVPVKPLVTRRGETPWNGPNLVEQEENTPLAYYYSSTECKSRDQHGSFLDDSPDPN